jgi:hypothetical protein
MTALSGEAADRPSPEDAIQSSVPLRGRRDGVKMGAGLPADAVVSLALEAAIQSGAGPA